MKRSLGIGTYRMSVRSKQHRQALKYAIEKGCELIDTSTNYTGGESESLIGEVLKELGHPEIKVISKVGYAQGQDISLAQKLDKQGELDGELVTLDEGLHHCIHPKFIEAQLERSLERLGLDKIEAYLLHNPEYYLMSEGSDFETYYARIEKALCSMQALVDSGKIKYFGMSSNTFVEDPESKTYTDFDRILGMVERHNLTGFKYVQFPFNLIEMNAMKRYDDGLSLLEKVKNKDFVSLANRPLNAFSDQGGLLRLAEYEGVYEWPTLEEAQRECDACLDLIEKKIQAEDDSESIFDVPLIKQFQEMWYKLQTPDAVEQVFHGHFFPFLARVWGGQGLTPEEAVPFYDLFETALMLSREQMDKRAKEFKKQALDAGLIAPHEEGIEENLAEMVIDRYLNLGVDYVLVGMKNTAYIDMLLSSK